MSFIDWSDSEGLIDLLKEFVRDELSGSSEDAARKRFLSHLLADIGAMHEGTTADAIQRLREIQESIQKEFSADPASLHLSDLIQELERMR